MKKVLVTYTGPNNEYHNGEIELPPNARVFNQKDFEDAVRDGQWKDSRGHTYWKEGYLSRLFGENK